MLWQIRLLKKLFGIRRIIKVFVCEDEYDFLIVND